MVKDGSWFLLLPSCNRKLQAGESFSHDGTVCVGMFYGR